MKKRFLLNGVNVNRAGIRMHNRAKDAVNVYSYPALAALPRLNKALFRTQLALNFQLSFNSHYFAYYFLAL